ncbi:SIMPL domain-containing protein [Acidiphilium sp. PA]|uniref:SIMPL domain-containing protein n=1 Tax=Acidiphilium sp. PA TaxID=2871705 RepID=UPI002243E680|nr:SIMPL domain-containing protein [Acidiphilium sp. PA]MCW8307150.1 SIMPL domain-containing protein [Acidiphilium sp. PA]
MLLRTLTSRYPLTALIAAGVTIGCQIPRARAAEAGTATELTLSVTGQASHKPDVMVATMAAQATAKTAAAAQSAVNRAVAAALAATNAIKALRATTGGYEVYPADPKQAAWHASQTIDLRLATSPGSDHAKDLRRMIGMLQAKGMTLESIGATLSQSAARKTRAAAIKDAVAQMRAEADATAKSLGDHVSAITKLSLTTQSPFRPVMMAARIQSAAPQMRSGPITEQINLSATVTLRAAP